MHKDLGETLKDGTLQGNAGQTNSELLRCGLLNPHSSARR